MKKQLLAAAVAGAFASMAFAANVTVYGTVDTGFVYSSTEFGGAIADRGGVKDLHSFSLESSVLSSSRFGLKGMEDLGGGYSVEFLLENGFSADTGKLGNDGRLFGREARLSLNTPYGTASFGRMGALTSGLGTYDIFMSTGDSFDGGTANYIATGYWFNRYGSSYCYDNMITLVTPTASGFTGYAQYSFQTAGVEKTSARNNDRYMALGLTYSAGPLNAVLVADMVKYSNETVDGLNYGNNRARGEAGFEKYDDAKAVSFGINYDFGAARGFFGAQYGKNEKMSVSLMGWTTEKVAGLAGEEPLRDGSGEAYGVDCIVVDGYSLHLGGSTSFSFGNLFVSTFYGHYEATDDSSTTAKKYGAGVGYGYPVSKRTTLYAAAGYAQMDLKSGDESGRLKGYDIAFGLNHKF